MTLLVTCQIEDDHDLSDIINSSFGNKCLVIRTITKLESENENKYIIETYRGKGREKMDKLIEKLKADLTNVGQLFMYETDLNFIKFTIKLA
jgi:hypothetical protein